MNSHPSTERPLESARSLLAGMASVFVLLFAALSPLRADWFDMNWKHRVQITVSSSMAPGAVSDFPVCVVLSTRTLSASHEFWTKADNEGDDLLMTSADGLTRIPLEVSGSLNLAGTKFGEIYFRAPSLSSSSASIFYLYYGNAAASQPAPGSQYGRQNVWSTGYVGVWHLSEQGSGTAGDYKDSTANGNDSQGISAQPAGTDVWGGLSGAGQYIGTASSITVADSVSLQPSSVTVSCWMKRDGVQNDYAKVLWKGSEASAPYGAYGFHFYSADTTRIMFQIGKNDGSWTTLATDAGDPSIDDAAWFHLSGTYDDASRDIRFYVNGSQRKSGTSNLAPLDYLTSTAGLGLGTDGRGKGSKYTGWIDEVRISSAVRPAAWIRTEYNNQNDPSSHISAGGADTFAAPNVSTPVFSSVNASGFTVSWTSGTGAAGYNPEGRVYHLEISPAPDFSSIVFSSTTVDRAVSIGVLDANTTYYARAAAVSGASSTPYTLMGGTCTLAMAPVRLPSDFVSVQLSSIAVQWVPLAASPQNLTAERIIVQASSSNFNGGTVFSSASVNPTVGSLMPISLNPNSTYYFRVGAMNWRGVYNYTSLGATGTLASLPTNASVNAVYVTSVAVAWDLPLGVWTGFKVEASTHSDFSYVTRSSATLSHDLQTLYVTGLISESVYHMRVGSLNRNMVPNYVYAGIANTLTDSVAPGAVPDLAAFSASSDTVRLVWSTPLDPTSDPLDGQFRIQYSSTPGVVYSTTNAQVSIATAGAFSGSGQASLVTGLIANTTYFFRLWSADSRDNWSPVSNGATAPTLPLPAPDARLFSVDLTSASAVWAPLPASPSSSTCQGYRFEAASGTSFSPILVASETRNGSASGLTVSGLDANTTYYFRAGTIGWDGAADFTVFGDSVTLANGPERLGSDLVSIGQSSVTLGWAALPGSPQSASAEGYLLEASSSDFSGGTVHSSFTAGVSLSTLTLNGIEPSVTYYFRVGSVNWSGRAHYVTLSSAVTPIGIPASPAFAEVAASSVSVGWARPVNGSGGFLLEASTDPAFASALHSSSTFNSFLTTLTVSGIIPNTTYFFRTGSYDLDGSTRYAPSFATCTLSGAPVSAIFAGVFITSAAFEWSAPPGGSARYTIHASTSPDYVPVFQSSTTANFSFAASVTGLLSEATYYFRVGSFNWGGLSNFISIGSAAMVRDDIPPARISNLSASVLSTSAILLSWLAPADVTDRPIDGEYALQNADTSGTAFSTSSAQIVFSTSGVMPGDAQGMVFGGVSSNSTYYFRLWLSDVRRNWSPVSNGATVVTLADPVPETVVDAVWTSSATVRWTALPLSPSSASCTGYRLDASPLSDFSGGIRSSVTLNPDLGVLTVTALDPNTTYYFRAGTLNGQGVPNYVTAGASSTLANAPSRLASDFSAARVSSVSVVWQAMPPAPQSLAAEGFTVEASSTGFNGSGVAFTSSAASGNLDSLCVEGLDPNTTYFFRAASLNWDGRPNVTVLSATSTLARAPLAPEYRAVEISSVTVQWGVPAGMLLSYRLEASSSSDFSSLVHSSITANSALDTLIVTGLINGRFYYFRVGSVNWNGVPNYTYFGSTRTLQDSEPPLAIGDLAASTIAASTVRLAWTTPSDATDIPLSGAYAIYYSTWNDTSPSTSAAQVLLPFNTHDAGSPRSTDIAGLLFNTTYYFRAWTSDVGGNWSPVSNGPSAATLARAIPDARISDVQTTSVTVQWTAFPVLPSTASCEGFILECSLASDFSSIAVASRTSNPGTASLSAEGLVPNTRYYFRAGTFDWWGIPNYVSVGSSVTPASLPSSFAPSSVQITSFTVAWQANGNPSGTRYEVHLASSADFPSVDIQTTTALSFLFTGLTQDSTYHARIRALNSDGVFTVFTGTAQVKMLRVPILTPQNFRAVGGAQKVTLDWDDNREDGLAGYTLFKSSISGSGPFEQVNLSLLTTSYYLDLNVTDGIRYHYYLTARHSIGITGPQTPTVSAVPTSGLPAPRAPSGLRSATSDDNLFTVSWNPVVFSADNSTASTIVGYRVYTSSDIDGGFSRFAEVSRDFLSWTSSVPLPNGHWVTITAFNDHNDESEQSSFVQVGSEVRLIRSRDRSMQMRFSPREAAELNAGSNSVGEDVRIDIGRAVSDEQGKTITSYDIKAYGESSNRDIGDFRVARPALALEFKYVNRSTAAAGSPSFLGASVPAPSDVAVFRYNGVEYVKLGGDVDRARGTISLQTSYTTGRFQVRQSMRASSFEITQTEPRKVFTPNGDGVNDVFTIFFENPKDSVVSQSKVYDLDGREVADLILGPSGNSLSWDGRGKDGSAVAGGIYVYQIESEGKSVNGTVVVFR